MSIARRAGLILLLFPITATAVMPVLDHDLSLILNDEKRTFTAHDHIVVDPSAETGELPNFSLNPKWEVVSLAFDGRPVQARLHIDNGHIDVPEHTTELDIRYGGEVDPTQWPYIVWLPGDGWYPEVEDYRVRFELTLHTPSGWNALTQGVPLGQGTNSDYSWRQKDPQQGIYLVTGPWRSHFKHTDQYRAGVLLIKEDAEISRLYLDATLKNLERYSQALGDYPYFSFTLVENRRQTGWGMPAFTLLGSKIIRLPFIVNTSFPHEILHNWWGNGVFVDRLEGNWSEGLTTYLSDYLMGERRGNGRQYRLDTLIAWQDFAARGSDFPLAQFIGRHDRATQAVGYGKGMFLFHMLRRELGDTTFLSGLRDFYARFSFHHARFSDIQHTFERVCGCLLERFFSQWLNREGAPTIRLDSARSWIEDGKPMLTVVIGQSGGRPWDLSVPVRVMDNTGKIITKPVRLTGSIGSSTFSLSATAARVDVDPEIELFRILNPGEKPTTFSKVFAAEQATLFTADDSFSEAAKAISQHQSNWRISRGAADGDLGNDVVVLLGWQHALATDWFSSQRAIDHIRIRDGGLYIEGLSHTLDGEKVIALVDTLEIGGSKKTVLWIATNSSTRVADLLSRLTHYGRFSYVIFDSPDARAVTTGQWPTEARSLSRIFDSTIPVPVMKPPLPLF